MPRDSAKTPSDLNLSWLVKLRWAAMAGQTVTIIIVDRAMNIPLPLVALFSLISLGVLSNLACVVLLRSNRDPGERILPMIMMFDTLLLTGLLYFSGGPFNPFSFLYLVQIALAAVVLPARFTWALVSVSLVCSAVLFIDHRDLAIKARSHDEHMLVHLIGMWVAFGVAAAFIVYFLMRITRALSERETELAAARHLSARQEKLASLATLAAGAAHELATPLSTIAIAAKELERHLGHSLPSNDESAADAALIRREVQRCRAILDRMATSGGDVLGEAPTPTALGILLKEVLAELAPSPRIRIELDDAAARTEVCLPQRALAQALRGLVKNAQDASSPGGEVLLTASTTSGPLLLKVVDQGAGMKADILARVGEPFFTTKAPGSGMGLGFFVARTVVEQLGGLIELASVPGQGTTATVTLPPSSLRQFAASRARHDD